MFSIDSKDSGPNLFSAGDCAYQIEGGRPTAGPSIGPRSRRLGNFKAGHRAMACDTQSRPETSISRDGGFEGYRLSFAWRSIPAGLGVNQAWLDFYDRLIDGIWSVFKPFATLITVTCRARCRIGSAG